MAKRSRKYKETQRRTSPGTAPGTLTTPPDSAKPKVAVIAYDGEFFEETSLDDLSVLPKLRDKGHKLWVDVQGLGDIEVVQKIGEVFRFHMLALEDVVNLHQRPKVDPYDHYVYCVLRMPELSVPLRLEQMSVFFGKDFVVTFQEDPGDPLDPVRERLRNNRTRIRSLGSDYLAYSIIDAIVDHYFPVLEGFADRIDELEEQVLATATPEVLSVLQGVRRDLLLLRRSVWPLREMIGALAREDCADLVTETTTPYLRDCQDHAAQLMDVLDNCRELSVALMEAYLSSVALRTNEVMRVLTIMSTIFIPLTFIAGVYGMNFDPDSSPFNMPELRWRFGYPAALLSMLVTALGLVYFFRRKGWFASVTPNEPPASKTLP